MIVYMVAYWTLINPLPQFDDGNLVMSCVALFVVYRVLLSGRRLPDECIRYDTN